MGEFMIKKLYSGLLLFTLLLMTGCAFTNVVEENKYPKQDTLVTIDSFRWNEPKPSSYVIKALVQTRSGVDAGDITIPDNSVQSAKARLDKWSDAFKTYFLNRFETKTSKQTGNNVVLLLEPVRMMKYVNGGKSMQISASVFREGELIWYSVIDAFGPESITDEVHVKNYVEKLSNGLEDSNIRL